MTCKKCCFGILSFQYDYMQCLNAPCPFCGNGKEISSASVFGLGDGMFNFTVTPQYPKVVKEYNNKTRYRVRMNRSGREYLEYQTIKKILWITNESWRFVPTPFWDDIYGRSDLSTWGKGILSGGSLEYFAERYPDIEEYLDIVYNPIQNHLMSESEARIRAKRQVERERLSDIKYL